MTEYAGGCLEVVVPENPHLRIRYGNGPSTSLMLSPHGLYDGSGIFVSPVLDIGYVAAADSIDWESSEPGQSSVVIEVRMHAYRAPVLNSDGSSWSSEEMPSTGDVVWGDDGSLAWIAISQGGAPLVGQEFRFVQYRATLTVGGT